MSDTPLTDALIAHLDKEHRARMPFVIRQIVNPAKAFERQNAAMRHSLKNILARIDDDEWIPTEYVAEAREAIALREPQPLPRKEKS